MWNPQERWEYWDGKRSTGWAWQTPTIRGQEEEKDSANRLSSITEGKAGTHGILALPLNHPHSFQEWDWSPEPLCNFSTTETHPKMLQGPLQFAHHPSPPREKGHPVFKIFQTSWPLLKLSPKQQTLLSIPSVSLQLLLSRICHSQNTRQNESKSVAKWNCKFCKRC